MQKRRKLTVHLKIKTRVLLFTESICSQAIEVVFYFTSPTNKTSQESIFLTLNLGIMLSSWFGVHTSHFNWTQMSSKNSRVNVPHSQVTKLNHADSKSFVYQAFLNPINKALRRWQSQHISFLGQVRLLLIQQGCFFPPKAVFFTRV